MAKYVNAHEQLRLRFFGLVRYFVFLSDIHLLFASHLHSPGTGICEH